MSKVESYANTDGGWGPQQPQMTDGRKQSVEKLGGGHSLSQLISAGAFATLLTLTSSPARAANECGAIPATGSPPAVVCEASDKTAADTFTNDQTGVFGNYRAAVILYEIHKDKENRSGFKITLNEDIEVLGFQPPGVLVYPSNFGLNVLATRSATDGIVIDSSADITDHVHSAIRVSTDASAEGNVTVPITINVLKGVLSSRSSGTTGVIHIPDDGNHGDITVNFAGTIRTTPRLAKSAPSGSGIQVYRRYPQGGDVEVTLQEGSRIGSALSYGVYIHAEWPETAASEIKVTANKGAIIGTAEVPMNENGIHVFVDKNAQAAAKKVTITNAGVIHAAGNGIYVTYTTESNHGGGEVSVTIAEGGQVLAGKDGVYLKTKTMQADEDGSRRAQTVTVNGEVRSGAGKAAIHLFGGGTITLGEKGQLVPDTEDAASRSVKVTSPDTITGNKPNLLVRLDRNFKGIKNIENTKTTTAFQYKTTADGTYTDLPFDTPLPLPDASLSSLPCGFYNDCTGTEEVTAKLEDHANGVFSLKFTSKLKELTAPITTTPRPASKRGRVYEALPSVLWDLTGAFTDGYVPPVSTDPVRVAQSGSMAVTGLGAMAERNGWGQMEGGSSERRLRQSTAADLSYRLSHSGFAAGVDLSGEQGVVYRVGLHRRQAKARITDGGSVEVAGTGAGVGIARALGAGLSVYGSLDATRFDDIEIVSSEMVNDKSIDINPKSKGTGYALSLGVSKRMEFGGMALTQRGDLRWSSVSMKEFTAAYDAAVKSSTTGQTRTESATETVTMKKDSGLTGRYGVMLEGEYEHASGTCCRLFGSLDLEHDFHGKRRVTIAGTVADQAFSNTVLSEVKPTSMRLGFGGSKSWNGGESAISGAVYHTTAGRGNSMLSGRIAVSFRF